MYLGITEIKSIVCIVGCLGGRSSEIVTTEHVMSTSEQDSILCIGNKYFVITLHTVTVLERKIQLSIVAQASKYMAGYFLVCIHTRKYPACTYYAHISNTIDTK